MRATGCPLCISNLPWLLLALSCRVLYAQDDLQRPALDEPRRITGPVADFDNGSTIYDSACLVCHGETGEGSPDGPAITDTPLSLGELIQVIERGSNTMPAFGVFTDQQLLDIGSFVKERL